MKKIFSNKKNAILFPTIFILLMLLIFNNTKSIFINVLEKFAPNEINVDNWEISTVFFDSTVDNGETPLTEINWEISDGYKALQSREIRTQIIYKNKNVDNTYNPGELVFTIPNLIYSNRDIEDTIYNSQLKTTIKVAANSPSHSGLEWTLFDGKTSPSDKQKTLTFKNAVAFDSKANFQGIINITYTLMPEAETPEKYDADCVHSYSKKIKAILNDKKESNEITFDYKRTYVHPWKQKEFKVYKDASKIRAYDGLGEDAEDYTWVNYTISNDASKDAYPNIGLTDYYMTDQLPTDCKILDSLGAPIETENGLLTIENKTSYSFYVGYPKSIYNEEKDNLNFDNTVNLYGTYTNEDESKFLATAKYTSNLNKFEFKYDGDLYGITKTGWTYQNMQQYAFGSTAVSYETIAKDNGLNKVRWGIETTARYNGTPLTIRVGDDLLYRTDKSGKYVRATDDEFYYTNVYYGSMYNGNGNIIPKDKYNMSLWVRYANTDEYVKYGEDFKNIDSKASYGWSDFYRADSGYKSINFKKDEKIVGWYIQVDDLKEGLSAFSNKTDMRFIAQDIAESGTFYNFAYLKVFCKDEDGNLELLNPTKESSYANIAAKEIAKHDLEKHENFLQRATSSLNWAIYKVRSFDPTQTIRKSQVEDIIQNEDEKAFYGFFNLRYTLKSQEHDAWLLSHINLLKDEDFQTNFAMYDLLPKGMELISTEKELIESLYVLGRAYDKEENLVDSEEIKELLEKNLKVKIDKNWRNTGRDRIEIKIDFSERPLLFTGNARCTGTCGMSPDPGVHVSFKYNYKISYDSVLEYGKSYKNYVYGQTTDPKIYSFKYGSIKDDGINDPDAVDITGDGDTEDKLISANSIINISYDVSSHQDVTKYVKTDKSDYSTGFVDSSNNTEYTYKLRVRSGSAKITDLVIYDTLENAHPERNHWKGEFIGIDTSYAESKGVKIKVYYSENTNVGYLKDDKSWKEYNDNVDKKKVKSLAFAYLNEDGNPAIIPANSLTYVLIKMKSPNDSKINSIAYNDCWTQWNALDYITNRPISFITGINSNVVKVALPNSIKPEEIEVTIEKHWNDKNNDLELRPKEIKYKIIANGDYENAKEFILKNRFVSEENQNCWKKKIDLEKYDNKGKEINYTIEEEPLILEHGYKYISAIDNYKMTNTLIRELVITKKWIDNNNVNNIRPNLIKVKILQNGKKYESIQITGENNSNEWKSRLIVPIYDENDNVYEYTLKEEVVDGYYSDYDNDNFIIINALKDGPIKNPTTGAHIIKIIISISALLLTAVLTLILSKKYKKIIVLK